MQKLNAKSIKISKQNPKAAQHFVKAMKAVEPDIKKAQAKFAKELNKIDHKAFAKFLKEEGIKLSPADKKAMEQNVQKMCKKMCVAGNKVVKEEFAKMSKGMVAAVKKAK